MLSSLYTIDLASRLHFYAQQTHQIRTRSVEQWLQTPIKADAHLADRSKKIGSLSAPQGVYSLVATLYSLVATLYTLVATLYSIVATNMSVMRMKGIACRGIVGLNCQPSSRGPRGTTEMGYPMYPPSLYRSISYASKLGVPMYITENGCPYVADTSERTDWINGYLTEVAAAFAYLL